MHFHYRVTFTGYVLVLLRRDLVTLTFDLLSVSCTVLLMFDPHTNFYYPTTIGYWVTSTEYLITFPWSETVTVHAPCYVTSNRGQKWSTFLKSRTPICLLTIQLLWATTTIKGSYILDHPHVKAVFGRKKTKVQSKSVPEMAVFRKFKGPNIKYSHRGPQKALHYPDQRHLTYFA